MLFVKPYWHDSTSTLVEERFPKIEHYESVEKDLEAKVGRLEELLGVLTEYLGLEFEDEPSKVVVKKKK